jgi:hypothetical protein
MKFPMTEQGMKDAMAYATLRNYVDLRAAVKALLEVRSGMHEDDAVSRLDPFLPSLRSLVGEAP